MTRHMILTALAVCAASLAVMDFVWAETDPAKTGETYSPRVDETYPTRVYWGDTHLHSGLSHDAFILGARLMPDDAYRFARGETIRASSGEEVRLQRPLDFLMVSDHAENLGVLPRLAAGDDLVPVTDASKRWAQAIAGFPPLRDVLQAEDLEAYNRGFMSLVSASPAKEADYALDDRFRRTVWEEVIANAERHNDPGRFTAFIGYEWSARALAPEGVKAPMIHRNVLFEGGTDEARQVLPFSRFDSSDPEDLWVYLQDYEDRTRGKVLAIPHNTNLSGGNMFKLSTYDGQPFTKAYAQTRSRWEPIAEVTQTKGDGETHSLLSPADEFADYETLGNPDAMTAQSYARPALKLGLGQEVELGVNPFKFGMIGSTDSHSGLSTANEDNYLGGKGLSEPSRYRVENSWDRSASGYAAVWATKNTREALFAAMRRREVYASTGPRITVRFFGGWDFAPEDAMRPELARIGYARGEPMGSDLTEAPREKSPGFLIRAVKDPDGANLDRVQVIKGWRDTNGELHEKVHNVVLSDGRREGSKGNVKPVGNTVDVKDASYTNSIGEPELAVVWTDPDFNRNELAFYYVRVLEIPTPRWTAYDAKFYDLRDLPDDIPMVTQERAYTSPIWYTP